ncbi:hypothetical protein B0A49_04500 [Cryomyces minteri]|nr:hypothetical protein B0A49_04500 [Cryomyces minteri]
MQHVPDIIVYDATPSALKPVKSMQYTVILTDPDAPSRDNPEWSEMCHWIATGYPGQPKWTEHVHYKPPGPPPKTGKHRYVFLLLAPANGTTEELHLQKPADRKHWGFEHERDGVRKWAQGQGLVVVGELAFVAWSRLTWGVVGRKRW